MSRAEDLAAAAEYYVTHDTGGDMDGGTWVEREPGVDLTAERETRMGVYSVRLPVSALNAVRERAAAAGLSTGALMRQWLEERLTDPQPHRDARVVQLVSRMAPQLRTLLAEVADPSPSPPPERASVPRRAGAVGSPRSGH